MNYQVTFTLRGFVVAVVYNNADNQSAAIDIARLYVAQKWDAARAELVQA